MSFNDRQNTNTEGVTAHSSLFPRACLMPSDAVWLVRCVRARGLRPYKKKKSWVFADCFQAEPRSRGCETESVLTFRQRTANASLAKMAGTSSPDVGWVKLAAATAACGLASYLVYTRVWCQTQEGVRVCACVGGWSRLVSAALQCRSLPRGAGAQLGFAVCVRLSAACAALWLHLPLSISCGQRRCPVPVLPYFRRSHQYVAGKGGVRPPLP